jgi:hypothetical protein
MEIPARRLYQSMREHEFMRATMTQRGTRLNCEENYILLIGKAWPMFWFAESASDVGDFISRNSSICAILRLSHVDVGQLQCCGGNRSPS